MSGRRGWCWLARRARWAMAVSPRSRGPLERPGRGSRTGSPSWSPGWRRRGGSAAGGGRKPAEQADPGLAPALEALVEPTRGGPGVAVVVDDVVGAHLAEELTAAGHPVSAETVGKLLRATGTACRPTPRSSKGRQHPGPGRPVPVPQRAGQPRSSGRRAAGDHGRREEEVATRGRTWRVNSQVGGPTLVGGVVPGQCSVARARSDVRRR